MKRYLLALVPFLWAGTAHAEVKTKTITYKHGDVTVLFSLRENAIAKEPGSSYLKPWRCVSRLGL